MENSLLATPTATPGALVGQTYGSANALVTTLTGQTGQLGSDGPKMLLGLQPLSDDKYQGGGTLYMLRGNIKVQQDVPWGEFHAVLLRISCRDLGIR